ncbi:MAG: hypothetical protein GEU83_19625 [Pseudonocardiaceae bacterium]|nr:hypothetical protein [Pseudonocardiaceae bacterium]
MSLVVVCSVSGSPGVSTTCVVLAQAWPRPACVAELDVSGGDLQHRLRLPDGSLPPASPSLVFYQARSRAGRQDVRGFAQPTAAGVPVLFGFDSVEKAPALREWWPRIAEGLVTSPVDVFADLGRFLPDSPLTPVASAADVLVLVVPPSAEGLVHARHRLAALQGEFEQRRGRPRIGVLMVTRHRDADRHVAAMRTVLASLPQVSVLGAIATDTGSVHRMATKAMSRNDRLTRSALPVAEAILALLPQPAAVDVADSTMPTTAGIAPPGRGQVREHKATG